MVLSGHLQAIREGEFPAKSGNEPLPETVAVPWRMVKSVWLAPPDGGLPSGYMGHGEASREGQQEKGSQKCHSGGSWLPKVRSVQDFHQVGGGVGFALTSTRRVWDCG